MDSVFSFVVGLLTAVLSLLGFVQQHPELPQSSRDQAQQIAQQAITQATQALAPKSQSVSSDSYVSIQTSDTGYVRLPLSSIPISLQNELKSTGKSKNAYLFLSYKQEGNDTCVYNNGVCSIGDGNQLFKDIDAKYVFKNVDQNKRYKIYGYLSYQPAQSEMIGCDPAVKGECAPMYSADHKKFIDQINTVNPIRFETDWFYPTGVSPAAQTSTGSLNLQTCTNSNYGFSVNYDPSIFKTYTNTSGYMGKPDYTNTLLSLFYGAGSITLRGDKTTTYEDCLRNSTDTKNVTPIVTNGITFYKSSSGEAGLGHSLSIDTYRTYYNGVCYSIHTWIESDRTGGGNTYTDTTKEKTYLQNVLSTFKFNVSQTQPAIHSSTQPDWKTYNGTSAPITFSYPGNYFVTETADNGYGNQIDINPGSKVGLDFVAQGTFTSNIEIQKSFVNPNDNIGTLQKSMDFDAGNKQNYYSPITIGGVQGYVGGFSNLQNSFGQSNTASIHFQKGNTLYRILLYGPISTDVYNTFVNSFKFTN